MRKKEGMKLYSSYTGERKKEKKKERKKEKEKKRKRKKKKKKEKKKKIRKKKKKKGYSDTILFRLHTTWLMMTMGTLREEAIETSRCAEKTSSELPATMSASQE